jgi:hypothetical protein
MRHPAPALILLFALFLSLPHHVQAQNEETLEEILEGFESDSPPGTGLQEVLEGFDDESPAPGQPESLSDDEALEGFDSEAEDVAAPSREDSELSRFSLDGYFKLSSVYSYRSHKANGTGTSWKGLTRLRPEVKLELDVDLADSWQARIAGFAFYDLAYAINGRNDYSDDVLNNYETEVELGEAYLQGSLASDLDLKAGRQIVVWGRSDNLRITDVLNPLDLRWPGLVDIEKLRLPVTMTRLDYYLNGWSLSGIALHEVRYNKNPEFGSDFFPGRQALPDTDSPSEGFALDRTQFAASLNGIFPGWDASLYLANIYAQQGFLSQRGTLSPQFEIKHKRLWMFGGAYNFARGNWLLKTEAAYFDGFEFANTPGKTYSRLDGLIGAEYSGLSDATISLELADRHFFDFDDRLRDSPDFQKEDLVEWALRIAKPFLNDTLELTLLATVFGLTGDQGAFERFTAEYDWTDAVQVTAGVVFYQSGDLRRTTDIGSNDSVYLEIQHNF